MGTPAKSRPLLKILLFVILTSIIVFSLAVMVYLKSDSFTNAVAVIVQAQVERPVEIGSISLEGNNRIVIREFVVRDSEQDKANIFLPRVEIKLSISGLLNRIIDEVILENPRIVLDLSKRKKSAAGKPQISLPFALKRGLVSDGEVELILDSERSLHMRSSTASIEEDDDKRSTVRVRALLSELGATVTIESVIDTERISVERVKVDISEISLSHLSGLDLISDMDVGELSGLMDISAHIESDISAPAELNWNSVVTVKNFSMRSEPLSMAFENRPVRLEGKGMINVDHGRIEINVLQTQFTGLKPWTLHGSIDNIYAGDPAVNLEINIGDIPISEVKRTVSDPAVEFLNEITVNGYGRADAAISGTFGAPQIGGTLYLRGDEFKKGSITVSSFTAEVPFEYKEKIVLINNASLKANELASQDVQSGEGVKYGLSDLAVQIPYFKYTYRDVHAVIDQLTIGRAAIHDNKKNYYEDKDIVVTAIVDSNLDEKLITLNDISIRTNSIESAAARASVNYYKPAVMDIDFKLKHFDIGNLSQKLFYSFLNNNGITVDGKGDLHTLVEVTMPEQGAARISGMTTLDISGAGFSTADEITVCEGMDLKMTEQFEFTIPPNAVDFTLNAEAAGFELLSGKFYGSFEDRSIQINSTGKYMVSDASLHITDLSLGMTGIGTMTVSGEILNLLGAPNFDTDIRFDNISNNQVYNFFVRETFQEQLPFLSRLEIQGMTSAGLSVIGTSREFSVQGKLHVEDMNILKGSEISVTGINVSLPLDITYPDAIYKDGAEQFGSIKIKEFIRKDLKFNDIELFPAIRDNALVFKKDIALMMLGGYITFKNIVYANILSPERDLSLSIEINDIDLLDASALLELPAFTGTLSGSIPKVSFIKNKLHTEGEILLELFGGEMKISGLSVDNVFSPIASMKSTVALEGIDLWKLTGTFDFGHISGIVRGKVQDLVIVNGQAESFKAFVETVKKKRVSQKINVEALKKISILGTGSSSSILDMGIYRFFKEYRYKKMGFRASLRNDNLSLIGVESKGNIGYLVVGGILPPKVDIITYNQNISFREIVSRLKRINRTGD